MMVKAGIFGATGYAGLELVQILNKHPNVEIGFAVSHSFAGQSLEDVYPAAPDLPLIAGENAPLDEVDVVFLCLPHGAAAETAVRCLNAGLKVIDLSADFRLKDVNVYNDWYNVEHPAPHLLQEAVYGLTEFARDCLPNAQLIATPGCYPTNALLALQPLMANQIKVAGTVVIDAKSGVSGAGRTPKSGTHFVTVADNFSPYKIGQAHRHLPEMSEKIGNWHHNPPELIFSPHLLPVPRGILANIYVPLAEAMTEGDIRQLYLNSYAGEPFVKVLPAGKLATLAHVTNSNRCAISLTLAGNMLIITSAIDNLTKGAAGQAVQNMNVVYGLEETLGLI